MFQYLSVLSLSIEELMTSLVNSLFFGGNGLCFKDCGASGAVVRKRESLYGLQSALEGDGTVFVCLFVCLLAFQYLPHAQSVKAGSSWRVTHTGCVTIGWRCPSFSGLL